MMSEETITSLEKKIDSLCRDIKDMKSGMGDLQRAIEGKESIGHVGIITRLNETRELAYENRSRIDKIYWIAAGAALGGGTAGGAVATLIIKTVIG